MCPVGDFDARVVILPAVGRPTTPCRSTTAFAALRRARRPSITLLSLSDTHKVVGSTNKDPHAPLVPDQLVVHHVRVRRLEDGQARVDVVVQIVA